MTDDRASRICSGLDDSETILITAKPPRAIGRAEFIAMLAAIMASSALGIDLMLPAFGDIREAFGLAADSTAVAGIVTTYFIGLAFAQVVWGPVADRFGRKPTLYAGLTLYALGALASALSPSLPVLYAARFVWGMGAAGPRVMTFAVVRDTYEGEAMAKMMSFIMAIFILVPVAAPSLGAAILSIASWRWVFGFTVIYAALIALWSIRLPESLHNEYRLDLEFGRIARAARFVVSNRQTLGYTLSLTALFGVFSSYLASSEIIFGEVYDRADLFPFIFGGISAVMGVAMMTNGVVVSRFGVRRSVHGVTIAFVANAAAMVAIAVVTDGVPPMGLFIVVLGTQIVLYALIFPNTNSIAMDPMGSVAGMAAAVTGFVSVAGGALLGSILDSAFDGTVLPISLGFLIAGVISSAVILWAERGRLFQPLRRD
jgi:DHA1 family bicyclomycin/chloramphenicol resistance-like MFS transporter